MSYKFHYTYTDYKDFPEATEISESRSRNFFYLFALNILLLLIFILIFFEESETMMSAENLIIFAALVMSLLHLIFGYSKVTDKKIKKAIDKAKQDRFDLEYEIATGKYLCKSIKVSDITRVDSCLVCYKKNIPVTRSKIKNSVGTRDIFVCNECIQQFKNNVVK